MKRIATMSVLLVFLIGVLANMGFTAELQKIVLLDLQNLNAFITQQMLDGLNDAGLVDQHNVTIIKIVVTSQDDPAQVIAKIKEIAPDVILDNTGFSNLLAALNGISIPMIARVNIEPFIAEDGAPKANITGVYTTLQDMIFNSYKFLQKVAPLKEGQQVVFLDNPEFRIVSKERVIDALERLHIPLKAVVNAAIYEDWQQAILQYSSDPEVGWVLRSSPTRKRDGSGVDALTEVYPWQREHLKKPTITYWDFPVQAGTLCAFGIDMVAVGAQCGKMAARVLHGEDIRTIKAEYPNKISIALNRKTATNLGLVFSLDVLNLANTIYDDYYIKSLVFNRQKIHK